MNILDEAEKLIKSPLAQRLLANEQASPAPSPAVVGVQNPADQQKDYRPLVFAAVALVVLVLGLAYTLSRKR